MKTVPYIVATAGHVDHGKSALVGALTGADPDRLPEEKARGLTIELGFTHLQLESPPGVEPALYDVGLIDVPGHEDFVKNMVAGVGSVDMALLVVAADDGWMPQTAEHVQILTYLGVTRAVVAFTKVDLVANEAERQKALRDRLRATPFAEAPIVPTSTRIGRGINELKSALAGILALTEPQRDIGKPRLMVDRAFLLRGVGTVVTGSLTGGTLRRGQSVIVQPKGFPARIRSLQAHHCDVEAAPPGSRVAMNLPKLTPGGDGVVQGENAIGRGDTVTIEGVGGAVRRMDVVLSRSATNIEDSGPEASALIVRSGMRVWLHHGSGAVVARLRRLDKTGSGHERSFIARLFLDRPICALIGDRFILRDGSERQTLAGGVVLDVRPLTSSRQKGVQLRLLRERAEKPFDAEVYVATTLMRDGAANVTTLDGQSRFCREDLETSIRRVGDKIVRLGEHLYAADSMNYLRQFALDTIRAFHREHPEQAGLPLVDLRRALLRPQKQDLLPPGDVQISAIIDDLCRHGCLQGDAVIKLEDHRPMLPPRLRPAGDRIRALLDREPLNPASRKEFSTDDLANAALRFLIASGEVIELGPDIVLSAIAYRHAVTTIRESITLRGPSTTSELKSALGSSRRVTVPLLERLDRDGITRRDGDYRVLR